MTKQRDSAAVFARRVARWQKDPVAFIGEFLGEKLWAKQEEICRAVRDHKRTAVASCHESGKTWLSARLAWWWALCFRDSRVITTGPSDDHVKRALWSEIRAAWERIDERWGSLGIPEPGIKQWEMRPRWEMVGFATRPDTAQQHASRFTGYHAPHVLMIFDEASGVHRLIWEAGDGLMTSKHVRHLAIGNPADPSGPFYDAWTSPSWHQIRIDAYECPNVKARRQVLPWGVTWHWVEEMREKYGPDYESDPVYQFKVRGTFPTSAIENLIAIADLEAAFERRPPATDDAPLALGVDVARYGDDLTTIYAVRGGEIVHAEAFAHRDGMQVAGRVVDTAKRLGLGKEDAFRFSIDATGGTGAGPVDRLRELGWDVNEENFGAAPRTDDGEAEYLNRRTELWWALRDWISTEAALADCPSRIKQELRQDLPALKYSYRSDGRRALEQKEDLKKRIGRSPDHGDALALALAWRTTRARLSYGPAPQRTVASIHDERRDHPEDTDHPGHAQWVREHRFDTVKLRGSPFRR